MDLFYIFSKFVNFFLAPANWIILLVIISFLIKGNRGKRKIYITAIIVFVLFSNKALFDVAANAWQPTSVILKDSSGYSAGILLGGMSQVDRTGKGYFTESSDRFIQAVQLYHRGVIKKLVITGATFGKDIPDEGDYLVPELIKAGIPAADIISETKAKNTFENAVFSKAKLIALQLPPPYVVITSAYHIPRSKMVFERAGVNAIMYPANYLAVNKTPLLHEIFLPNIKALDDWRYLIKECIGMVGYRLTNKA